MTTRSGSNRSAMSKGWARVTITVAGEEVVGVRVSRLLVEALPSQDFELVLERFETSKLSDLQ
jgi:hypothetical protein